MVSEKVLRVNFFFFLFSLFVVLEFLKHDRLGFDSLFYFILFYLVYGFIFDLFLAFVVM